MENDTVEKHQPKLYKRYVDDIINCFKKVQRDPSCTLDLGASKISVIDEYLCRNICEQRKS